MCEQLVQSCTRQCSGWDWTRDLQSQVQRPNHCATEPHKLPEYFVFLVCVHTSRSCNQRIQRIRKLGDIWTTVATATRRLDTARVFADSWRHYRFRFCGHVVAQRHDAQWSSYLQVFRIECLSCIVEQWAYKQALACGGWDICNSLPDPLPIVRTVYKEEEIYFPWTCELRHSMFKPLQSAKSHIRVT